MLGITRTRLEAPIVTLAKQAGSPWEQHQKEAALAAIAALAPYARASYNNHISDKFAHALRYRERRLSVTQFRQPSDGSWPVSD